MTVYEFLAQLQRAWERGNADAFLAANNGQALQQAFIALANLEQAAVLPEPVDALDRFAEKLHGRFWRVLNHLPSEEIYVSRQEAQKWMAEIDTLRAALRRVSPQPAAVLPEPKP